MICRSRVAGGLHQPAVTQPFPTNTCCEHRLHALAHTTGSKDANYATYGSANAVCDEPCDGDQGEICGGLDSISVYELKGNCLTADPFSTMSASARAPFAEVAASRTVSSATITCATGYVSLSVTGTPMCYCECPGLHAASRCLQLVPCLTSPQEYAQEAACSPCAGARLSIPRPPHPSLIAHFLSALCNIFPCSYLACVCDIRHGLNSGHEPKARPLSASLGSADKRAVRRRCPGPSCEIELDCGCIWHASRRLLLCRWGMLAVQTPYHVPAGYLCVMARPLCSWTGGMKLSTQRFITQRFITS